MALNFPREVKEILNYIYDGLGRVKTTLAGVSNANPYFWNVSAATTTASVTLTNDIIVQAIYISGAASGETDTFTITDASGNVYYSATASAIPNIRVLAGMKLNFVASGVSSPTGKLNLYGYY